MAARSRTWTRVCRLEDIDVEGGVTALVDGHAVAVFRTWDDRVFALGNYDPFSKASVLSRGIVGTRGEVPAYDVQVTEGDVLVGGRKGADTS